MSHSAPIRRRAVVLGAPAVMIGAGVAAPACAQRAAGYEPRLLTPSDVRADVALMRRALETIHPGLHRRVAPADLDPGFDRLAALGGGGSVSELDFYREISALLARIRCSHTKAEQPPGFERWRRQNPSHLPLRFRLVQGRMLVVSCADPGIARGTEVLAVNDRPVAELTDTLGRLVPIDGATTWSRATGLADDGDLMGADFDHFHPYVYGLAASFRLRLAAGDGPAQREVTLPAIDFGQWLRLANDGRPHQANLADVTDWRMADRRTGCLRVGTFVNYRRPVDAQALFARALADLRAQGAERLVVDLRDNGGGSDDAALALLDHLATGPYTYQKAIRLKAVRYGDLPQHIETWGDRQALFEPPLEQFTRAADGAYERRPDDHPALLKPRMPAAGAFAGPVAVLTSSVNASGATMVIAKLRDLGRARLVGGRCGGSGDGPTAGRIFNVGLPASGIRVRVPLAFNQMAVTRFEPDGGVTPDVLVEESVEDFRLGRDRALETALARGFA